MKTVLDVDLNGLALRSPVMAASGCLRSLKDVHGLLEVKKLGAIVTESITLRPVAGAPGPRVAESPAGIVWATGLQNAGVDAFATNELPQLARTGVPLIVSVAGSQLEEYVRVATSLADAPGVVALEVNLAVVNAERGGSLFAHRADHAAEVVGAVSRLTRYPVFAKLSADVSDIVDVAGACVQAGAHGLTMINAMPGMAIDVPGQRPALGAVDGWVSGDAIRPMALRAVHAVAQAMPDVPIIGSGGVTDTQAAVEFLLAGASAVQVGSAMLADPDAPIEITRGILRHLRAVKALHPAELRTRLQGSAVRAAAIEAAEAAAAAAALGEDGEVVVEDPLSTLPEPEA